MVAGPPFIDPGQDALLRRAHMTDEGRQVGNDPVRRHVRRSDGPRLRVIGWGIIHRAYMDTTIKDSSGGQFSGATLGAATVPMPLTPMLPGPSSPHSDFGDIPP